MEEGFLLVYVRNGSRRRVESVDVADSIMYQRSWQYLLLRFSIALFRYLFVQILVYFFYTLFTQLFESVNFTDNKLPGKKITNVLSCLIQEFICIDRYTFVCMQIMYEKLVEKYFN